MIQLEYFSNGLKPPISLPLAEICILLQGLGQKNILPSLTLQDQCRIGLHAPHVYKFLGVITRKNPWFLRCEECLFGEHQKTSFQVSFPKPFFQNLPKKTPFAGLLENSWQKNCREWKPPQHPRTIPSSDLTTLR